MKQNLILVDMPVTQDWGVLKGMKDVTGEDWEIAYKEGRLDVPRWRRILNFVVFPFTLLFHNVKKIVAWQQFFGFFFLLYCQLFHVKRNVNVLVLTFIYKERKGLAGRIYKSFIKNILENPRLKKVVVYSENEVRFYSGIFPSVKDKFIFLPLGISKIVLKDENNKFAKSSDYIFTAGASNRDYDFLFSVFKDSKYSVKIACDNLSDRGISNIEVLHNVHGNGMFEYLHKCKMVVIPLKNLDISSGQLMLLQAMQMGKPIIVSNNKGIYDYITDGKDGFIVENDKRKWLAKVEDLFDNPELYSAVSCHQMNSFNTKFTDYSLGKNVGYEFRKL